MRASTEHSQTFISTERNYSWKLATCPLLASVGDVIATISHLLWWQKTKWIVTVIAKTVFKKLREVYPFEKCFAYGGSFQCYLQKCNKLLLFDSTFRIHRCSGMWLQPKFPPIFLFFLSFHIIDSKWCITFSKCCSYSVLFLPHQWTLLKSFWCHIFLITIAADTIVITLRPYRVAWNYLTVPCKFHSFWEV